MFESLGDHTEFEKVFNGGYFVAWDCGADLSVDTIEARWQIVGRVEPAIAENSARSDLGPSR
ncbi:MAG: hypothetical protein P4L43_16065 [Syntrophobacteraceae bacterium]|nr:hypothetical protein [Syntrophobacteraceae bacterium]